MSAWDTTQHADHPNPQPSGNRPPRRKKPRIRYDRIVLVALVLIGLICLLVLGVKQCGKKDTTGNSSSGAAATTTQISTEPLERTLALTAEDVHKGSLILVNADHVYTFAADDVSLETVYEGRNSCYGVSDMEVSLDTDVIDHFNQLMQAYYNIYDNNDIMIVNGYRTREEQAAYYESKKTMLPGGYSDYQQLATMRGLQSMPQSMDLFCGIRTEKPIKPASVQERIHSGMLAFRMPFICMKMGFV